ncbi:hypothetical protein IHE55_29650 [Streptomyces pactum]|uniref:Uncharacterized protein n=1 Tax=Streptomyces pactum TaxID=68249 RepID=A0ABS0NU52_9ACTN|nr:hypothetical protein [Streptomyces pactum]MBH5338720.1 hypothetical protein [Streptomyces pactum]
MSHPRLPSTEAAVAAVHEVAREFGRELSTSHSIGTDQVSRRLAAGAFTVLDPDGSLPHEAYIELTGSPAVSVWLHPEGDARITVAEVDFEDVPRDAVPAFLRSVYGGAAYVKERAFPPSRTLIVPLPGGETYREPVLLHSLGPWLGGIVRG